MRGLLIIATLLVSVATGAEDWGPLQFLAGHWAGDGGGEPGHGSGSFSFTPDLQGKILVRKSFAEYPAANGKPAYRHDDLMIIYRDGPARQLRAIYFDNEEHAIPYSIKPLEGGVVFVSKGLQDGPRFRLTYTRAGSERLKLTFEVAAPGKDFTTHLEAGAHRESPPANPRR
jgi:hypothetical protein